MSITQAERDAALDKARAIIKGIRERGFKDGGASFSDAQIWQAILDVKDRRSGHLHDDVAVRLIEQVIEGATPAEAPHLVAPLNQEHPPR